MLRRDLRQRLGLHALPGVGEHVRGDVERGDGVAGLRGGAGEAAGAASGLEDGRTRRETEHPEQRLVLGLDVAERRHPPVVAVISARSV